MKLIVFTYFGRIGEKADEKRKLLAEKIIEKHREIKPIIEFMKENQFLFTNSKIEGVSIPNSPIVGVSGKEYNVVYFLDFGNVYKTKIDSPSEENKSVLLKRTN